MTDHNRNRSRRRNTAARPACSIQDCTSTPLPHTDTPLCAGHRDAIVADLMSISAGNRCLWLGCRAYCYGDIRICDTHLAIVTTHAIRRPFVMNLAWRTAHGTALDVNGDPVTQPQPEPKPTQPGIVYFLRIGGYIKIGWTSDLAKRMRQYPPDTTLLATRPGTRTDEGALHKRFAHLKTHGREWFPLAPQILEHIEDVVTEHGAPPAVDFSARRSERKYAGRATTYIGGPGRGSLPARTVRG